MHCLSDSANEMSLPPTVLSCSEQMVLHTSNMCFTRSIRDIIERGCNGWKAVSAYPGKKGVSVQVLACVAAAGSECTGIGRRRDWSACKHPK